MGAALAGGPAPAAPQRLPRRRAVRRPVAGPTFLATLILIAVVAMIAFQLKAL